MDQPTVTLTLTLPLGLAQQVLELVNAPNQSSADMAAGAATGETEENATRFDPLGALLDGRLKAVVEFIVSRDGVFFNDELAKHLEIDDPLTSLFLGHLTKKLRKAGIKADGHRAGSANWYTKNRSSGRTRLVVRPDVLEVMKQALG